MGNKTRYISTESAISWWVLWKKENMALVMGVVVAAVAWQRRNERKRAKEMKREMKRKRKKRQH